MFQRIMHVLLGTTFVVLLGIQAAWAVSFGKVDVASKMGEPFYAEVPLRLNEKETLRKTSVELGSSADYRILEVYRNPVLDSIRTDIVDDERGVRVTLTSGSAIDEAFFNIVLKVRYGRSTHYKKVPVFLDVPAVSAPTSGLAVKTPKAMAAVNAATIDPTSSSAFMNKLPQEKGSEAKEAFGDEVESGADVKSSLKFEPFDGWARTAKYGPMVYGDTITTVAQRLRVDDRFTNKQVMVALFEKNRTQFSQDNINLIKAGSYLEVPTAEEVGQVTPEAAQQFLSGQTKAWKAMQKQSKYAAVAEAQRTRYSSRVLIGKNATGLSQAVSARPSVSATPVEKDTSVSSSTNNKRQLQTSVAVKALEKKLVKKDEAFSALQQKMAELEQRLAQAANNGANKKPEASSLDVTSAALEAQNKRLELVITRLKAQLDQAKTNVNTDPGFADWILYSLIGLALLVFALLVAIFMLMKKTREHPADKQASADALTEASTTHGDDLDATKVMDADEFEMPVASGVTDEVDASGELFGSDTDLEEIPDLTDEETGEMEPFNSDESPDPNVNYLEDADVYLRYGMEDEAEEQARMALKLDPSSPEVHAKIVEIKRAKGDESGLNEAIAAAKVALTGSALALFESTALTEASENSSPVDQVEQAGSTAENDSIEVAVLDSNEADFDINSIGLDMSEDLKGATSDSSNDINTLVSGELDEVEVEGIEESDIEEFVDGLGQNGDEFESMLDDSVGSIDFGDINMDETAEVHSSSETQVVSSGVEEQEGLNDFELDKAMAAAEEEKTATSVAMDTDSIDPFMDASTALREKSNEEISVDWDVESLGSLAGEEEDMLSLSEERQDSASEDGLVDIDLGDMGLELTSMDEGQSAAKGDMGDPEVSLDTLDMVNDLPDLEAEETQVGEFESTFTMDAVNERPDEAADALGSDADEDVNLDDLEMDFELPDLDGEAPMSDDSASTFLMDADRSVELESLHDADTGSDVDLDSLADADVSLDDLEMDFELPDLDGEAPMSDDSASTFLMDADKSVELESLNDADTGSDVDLDSLADADVSLDDLEMDFELPDLDGEAPMSDDSTSTFLMDADKSVELESLNDADTGSDVDLDSLTDEDVNLDDLEMDFELPDMDGAEAISDKSPSTGEDQPANSEREKGENTDIDVEVNLDDLEMDFELPDLDGEEASNDLEPAQESTEDIDLSVLDSQTIDSIDSGMDDLDISTTTVDPVRLDFDNDDTDLNISMDTGDRNMLADLDAMTNESEDLDKTFVLNDVAKNKAMLEAGQKELSHHFDNIDDALSGASSVTDDPMLEPGGITQELENIHTQNPQPLDTIGVSGELDDLLKDLDGLLDEGKDKT